MTSSVRYREQVDPAGAVRERVLEQVCERLLDAHGIGIDDVGRRAYVDVPCSLVRPSREAIGDACEELVDRDVLRPDRQCALIGPGDQEEILRELREPVRLLCGRAHCRFELVV